MWSSQRRVRIDGMLPFGVSFPLGCIFLCLSKDIPQSAGLMSSASAFQTQRGINSIPLSRQGSSVSLSAFKDHPYQSLGMRVKKCGCP